MSPSNPIFVFVVLSLQCGNCQFQIGNKLCKPYASFIAHHSYLCLALSVIFAPSLLFFRYHRRKYSIKLLESTRVWQRTSSIVLLLLSRSVPTTQIPNYLFQLSCIAELLITLQKAHTSILSRIIEKYEPDTTIGQYFLVHPTQKSGILFCFPHVH